MSKIGSAKRISFNETNEALYNAFPNLEVPEYFPYDTPWPEWSDSELNSEKWDDGNAKISPKTVAKVERGTDTTSFIDVENVNLPRGLEEQLACWKRPEEMFPKEELVLYQEMNVEFELSVPSHIVTESGFFASFMELLTLFQFYALHEGFPVEWETPMYVANTQDSPWRPWHHIYACCKAGKGQAHKPTYSSYGKYFLRLFHLGAWRRFVVDDRIPCDKDGYCLLPVSQIKGEIWPILLTKGLLKIMSLSPSCQLHAMDLQILPIFTGWLESSMQTASKSGDDIWKRICETCPHYKWSLNEREVSVQKVSANLKESKKEDVKAEESKNCLLVCTLEGFPEEAKLSNRHQIGVLMCRDVPLVKVERQVATQAWKRLRWTKWAQRKGVWTDELLIPPYRCLLYFSYVRKLKKLLLVDKSVEDRLFLIPQQAEWMSALEASQKGPKDRGLIKVHKSEDDPVQWLDFSKIIPYLSSMNFLFKTSAFNTKTKATYIRFNSDKLGFASGGRGGKLPTGTFFLSPSMTSTQNEPPFVFCESLENILICFNLSVCPSKLFLEEVSLAPDDHPKMVQMYNACLIIERFDWRSPQQGEILADVKTVGSDTTCLFLGPGRHILRLWLDTDSPFVLQINSNADVFIFKGSKIRFLMSNESLTLNDYINLVSTTFFSLTQKYGKQDYAKALSFFYEALKSGNDLHIANDLFIDTFLGRLMYLLKGLTTNEDELQSMISAMQTLFLNPNLSCPLSSACINTAEAKTCSKTICNTKEASWSEILPNEWSAHAIRGIIYIQRIFRGYRTRSLLKSHNPDRKEFKIYSEKLKKISDLIFAPAKREVVLGFLIRDLTQVCPELLSTLKFSKELTNVVQTEEFTGTIAMVEPLVWVPLTRFVVACHSDFSIPCAFSLSCNLEQFILIALDNDTSKELFRLTNAVTPHYFRRNKNGYTIFGYGWNESEVKNIFWKMEILTMKHFEGIHPCNAIVNNKCSPYKPPILQVHELKNYYIPNHKSRICRCLIKVRKKMIISIRISTSYSEARFKVNIFVGKKGINLDFESYDRQAVAKGEATRGAVVFPCVVLDHIQITETCEESQTKTDFYTTYILEAEVRHDTWPLTSQEWGIVERIRTSGEPWPNTTPGTALHTRKSSVNAHRRATATRSSKRFSPESKALDNPSWLLQVVSDVPEEPEQAEPLIVLEDQDQTEAIKSMKMFWEENDPGRRKRGRETRELFLRSVHSEEKEREKQRLGEVNSMTELASFTGNYEAEDILKEDSFEILLRQMNSFNYLLDFPPTLRTLASPRILPKMPTSELLDKYAQSIGYQSTSKTCEIIRGLVEQALEVNSFGTMLEDIEATRKNRLEKAENEQFLLESQLIKENIASSELMDEAYELRLKVIQRVKKWGKKSLGALKK